MTLEAVWSLCLLVAMKGAIPIEDWMVLVWPITDNNCKSNKCMKQICAMNAKMQHPIQMIISDLIIIQGYEHTFGVP